MRKIIGIFFIIGLFVSCEKNVKVGFDHEAFYEQKQLWQTSNVTDYKYHLRAAGWYGMNTPIYDGTIIVKNGNYSNNLPVNDHFELDNNYSTIDEIYKTIENMFNENNNKKISMYDGFLDRISVTYDEINHIPIKIGYAYDSRRPKSLFKNKA